MRCASCSGPSDNGTDRCSWCAGIQQLEVRRDALRVQHDRVLALQMSQMQAQSRVGSGISPWWIARIAIAVALLSLRVCTAGSHY